MLLKCQFCIFRHCQNRINCDYCSKFQYLLCIVLLIHALDDSVDFPLHVDYYTRITIFTTTGTHIIRCGVLLNRALSFPLLFAKHPGFGLCSSLCVAQTLFVKIPLNYLNPCTPWSFRLISFSSELIRKSKPRSTRACFTIF